MPYSSGTFTRLYNWVQDAANSIKILSTKFDAEHDGFATGLSTAMCRDGQSTVTANLPMGGFRHTGVGDATARTEYASAAQIQDASLVYATAAGTANAITVTLAPAITAYATGMVIRFKAASTNTAAVTLAVNGLAAKDIKKNVSSALEAGNIKSGQIITVGYDGTNFQIVG